MVVVVVVVGLGLGLGLRLDGTVLFFFFVRVVSWWYMEFCWLL